MRPRYYDPLIRLALFDLDNTLVDRVAAFRRWASWFAAPRDLDPARLEELDRDGFEPRASFFAALDLGEDVDELVEEYRLTYPTFFTPPTGDTLNALAELRRRDFKVGVVTNGSPSQEVKIEHSGLIPYLDGWCVSGVVGVRKPDAGIFRLAAERCGAPLEGGWMVGDHGPADIAGAIASGLESVWIARGRIWEERDYSPTAIADTVTQAVATILA